MLPSRCSPNRNSLRHEIYEMGSPTATLVPHERILRVIHEIRGQKVIFDADMAALYCVETRVLIQAVKRNAARFPSDFMFQLTAEEFRDLRSQNVMTSSWGGRRSAPYAFTEQGVAMLSSVLRSKRGVAVNVEIMRTFVKLREMLATHRDLLAKLNALETRYDAQFKIVFDAIRNLMSPAVPPRRQIGFETAKRK